MNKITPDDIYESDGIIVECMEEDVEEGIKQLHYAVKLQELVKEIIKTRKAHQEDEMPCICELCLNPLKTIQSLVEESEAKVS